VQSNIYGGYVPAPNTLAVLDSLLYTLADDPVPAATFATASEGDGVIVKLYVGGYEDYEVKEGTTAQGN